jgi:signal transduction histidine kinase
MGLRDLVDRTLSGIRMAGDQIGRERVLVAALLNEVSIAASLHAESRDVQFSVDLGDPAWAVTADPQVLASAVTNLLNNAFKFTPAGGHVILRARTNEEARLLIEVQDECGGFPASAGDPFQPFAERRGRDRTGLGLGLSMARKAVRAHDGDIHIENIAGKGCIFIIDVPLAAEDVPASPDVAG